MYPKRDGTARHQRVTRPQKRAVCALPKPAGLCELLLRERCQLVEHLVVLGEAADLVLAEDEPPIRLDVEDPARTLDELGLDPELLLDRGRQTGGLGQIVSLHAIGDADLHA